MSVFGLQDAKRFVYIEMPDFGLKVLQVKKVSQNCTGLQVGRVRFKGTGSRESV